jgi:hypothetical protein
VSAFINTTLNFNAHATAGTVNGNSNWSYGYGVKFLYRIGLAAIAEIYLYGQWRTKAYYPVDWQTIPIYNKEVSSTPVSKYKRSLPWALSEAPLPHPIFEPPDSGYLPTFQSTSKDFDRFTNNASILTSRQTDNPNPSGDPLTGTEFKWGDFTCTTNSGSICQPDSVGVDPGQPSRRDLMVGSMSNIAKLFKRATSECPKIMPRLYCKFQMHSYYKLPTWNEN